MIENVKPRRAYRSPKRAERAEQTRHDVARVASVLFRAHGYAAVTMSSIATDADVSVETIYRAYGSKAGLFKAVIDAAVAGGPSRADTPVEMRPAIRTMIVERDPKRQVELYAATQPGIHRRSGPLLRVLHASAGVDSELGTLWTDIEQSRRSGQERFVRMLAERGALRPDQSIELASDALWTLCSLAIYDMLVERRGWPADQYEAWLADALKHLLLPGES